MSTQYYALGDEGKLWSEEDLGIFVDERSSELELNVGGKLVQSEVEKDEGIFTACKKLTPEELVEVGMKLIQAACYNPGDRGDVKDPWQDFFDKVVVPRFRQLYPGPRHENFLRQSRDSWMKMAQDMERLKQLSAERGLVITHGQGAMHDCSTITRADGTPVTVDDLRAVMEIFEG